MHTNTQLDTEGQTFAVRLKHEQRNVSSPRGPWINGYMGYRLLRYGAQRP